VTASPPARGSAPWDVSFLRPGLLVTLVLTAVAAPVVGLTVGWADAVGVLVGAAVVSSFFCVSAWVIAWAGRIDDSYALVAALGTFAVKVLVLFAVLQAFPDDGWVDLRVLAWTVVAGALLWSGVQARWVWTRQLYYVTPPAPPRATPPRVTRSGGPAAPVPGAADDPETPTTRG
jgi:hypothetical protein